ncbi:MAG: hypothetical protein LBO07_01420 [Coriobacteriales bacterium]|nr:hypothetical protein [Coriobacteriales bacterium]
MEIIVALKVVLDDQDIALASDGSLDTSRAHQVASLYDLNALEAAVQLAALEEGSRVTVLTVGGPEIDDSKLRKNILARGADELIMLLDEAARDWGSFETARALAAMIAKRGTWDLVVCGDGSADRFAQQVDVQLAAALDTLVFDAVVAWEWAGAQDGRLSLKRKLEDCEQTLACTLPLVVSVMPDIATPRICGMKEILAAGKKPVSVLTAAELALDLADIEKSGGATRFELIETRAPARQKRAARMYEAASSEGLRVFCAEAAALIG